MSIWLCTPSARPNGGTARLWAERGYRVALWRDPGADMECDLCLTGEYPGHAAATNAVIHEVLRLDPEAQWVVNAGDDTDPDPRDPNQIAFECGRYFGELHQQYRMEPTATAIIGPNGGRSEWNEGRFPWSTFGVMQPTGDPWVDYSIERICGSPWLGREFCERINGGQGPFWTEYWHMFSDEEMNCVTKQLGILWQRRDVTHMHHHWQREGGVAPAFLARANSGENWNQMQALFNSRKRAGFPGHEPIGREALCA